MSATHNRFGPSATKLRSTRSGAGRALRSRTVVVIHLRRLTPANPVAAFARRHPVANRLGRRLELLREIVGTTPCAHQLHHSAPVFRRIPCMTLGHRGSPSLSPLRHCPPNRVNSNLPIAE